MKRTYLIGATTLGLILILSISAFETMAVSRSQALNNIPVGRSWPRSIAIDPSRGLIYVDSVSGFYPSDGYSFEVLNGSSGQIINTVPFPAIPGEITVDEKANLVYALGSNSSFNSVFVYNPRIGNFDQSIAVNAPSYDLAFDPLLNRLFVATEYGLLAINASSDAILSSVILGNFSEGIAIDETSQSVYVANYLSRSISVVSASTLSLIKTIQLSNSSYPMALALDPVTSMLYTTTDENYIIAIDTHTNAIDRDIQITPSESERTFSIAYDQKDNILYVAAEPGTIISEVDGTSGNVISNVSLSYSPYEMSVDQANGKLYVSNYHQLTSVVTSSRLNLVPIYYLEAGAIILAAVLLTSAVIMINRKLSLKREQTSA